MRVHKQNFINSGKRKCKHGNTGVASKLKNMTNIVDRIDRFNQGRNPELLEFKYKLMRSDVFSFFRGTCHLFYEDLPANFSGNVAPHTWVCGDLHLENFGSYKGNNRLVYFDVNDFDESALAPCTWDLTRLITSVLVASGTLKVDNQEALSLCNSFLDAYTHSLSKGNPRSVETETAQGLVKDLLEGLQQRKRKDFLKGHVHEKKGQQHLIIDNKHTHHCSVAQQEKVTELINTWAKTQTKPEFFQVLDVAYRIAGTGSLGVERYVILVEGKGSPNYNFLLDLKEESPSSLQPYLKVPQPYWNSQAEREVAIQERVQGTSPALLSALEFQGKPYVLRELQPFQDKVDLNLCAGKLGRLQKLMQTMGEVVAWDQLRSGGRQGSAIADDLIRFANSSDWRNPILDYAQSYSVQVEHDYQEFRAVRGLEENTTDLHTQKTKKVRVAT
jgi:uncharacterized protein (DUF2252 family)